MRNQLTEINVFLFEGLENLAMLYLQENRISYLDENAFRDLIALRYLWVYHLKSFALQNLIPILVNFFFFKLKTS